MRFFKPAALALAGLLSACVSAPKPPEGPWLDFATLELSTFSNRALACDGEICPRARINRETFAFAASAEAVALALGEVRPGAQLELAPNGDIRARYVAVTPLLRFRDDVDLLIRQGPSGARLAAYSRSRVGRLDFGANRARVEALDRDIRAELARRFPS